MRPTVEKRYVFIGAIEASELQTRLRSVSQNKRDSILRDVLDRALGSSARDVAGRLGTSSFTLTSSYDIPQRLGLTADELEVRVAQEVGREVEVG
jgi:hypothetical protein